MMIVTSLLCSKCNMNKCFIIYPTNVEKMVSQYFTGSQTKNTSIAAFTCFAWYDINTDAT